MKLVLSLIVSILLFSCHDQAVSQSNAPHPEEKSTKPLRVIHGDEQLTEYLPLLQNKSVSLVVNQSSVLGNTHLIDTLMELGIGLKNIFAPEHGIRGNADAGEHIEDGKDQQTGLPIISLYGTHKKPTPDDLKGIDVVLFDLQDVGARFYTYISTMHYVMEACAQQNIQFIVLDRPNPNGDYLAGPVLEKAYRSFVGLHPIPIVHGNTVGELAQMINGENWLENNLKVDLKVIKCLNYTHKQVEPLAIKPSPNLPNLNSIRWYPTLCLFEPTVMSIGRGTYSPFEVVGNPNLDSSAYRYSFTPISIQGMSKSPKHQDQTCFGYRLDDQVPHRKINYEYLVEFYEQLGSASFFSSKDFFFKLCGTRKIYDALQEGKTAQEIASIFENDLKNYKKMRTKYLLYPDFDE